MSPFSHNDRASCQKLEHTEAGQRGEKVAATCSAASAIREPAQRLGTAVEISVRFSAAPCASVEDRMPGSVSCWPDSAEHFSCSSPAFVVPLFSPAALVSKLGPLVARQLLAQGIGQLELLQTARLPPALTSA